MSSESGKRRQKEQGDSVAPTKHQKHTDGSAQPPSAPMILSWDDSYTAATESVRLFENSSPETQEIVANFLKEQNVETLGKLNAKLQKSEFAWRLASFCRESVGEVSLGDYAEMLKKLRSLDDPLQQLNQQVLSSDFSGISHKIQEEIFSVDLVSIAGMRQAATERGEPFKPVIVSGSSGAGKTTFASAILPNYLFRDAQNIFCVIMARGSAIPTGEENTQENETAGARMGDKICKHIRVLLGGKSITMRPDSSPLDKEMLLVIDEMGLQEDTEYIGTKEKIDDIRQKVEEKIATNVQLVVVGTGVDMVTSNVNTDHEAAKVSIKPWNIDTIISLAKAKGLDGECLDVLRRPILTDLGSNARAALFMIEELKRHADIFGTRAGLIDSVVSSVVFRYINSNGLGRCSTAERRHVVQVVLQTLRHAQKGRKSIFTIVNGCTDIRVRRVAIGLMDFHLETEGSQLKLHKEEDFAVSVSPAVTIVLSALMGATEAFSGTWEGAERIGALDALGVLFMNSSLPIPEMSVVRAKSPFPATSGTKNFKAPVVGRDMVLLNGKGAQHADIISHYRFGQFKKSEKELADLDIQIELGKMGLMKKEWYDGHSPNPAGLASRWMTRKLIEQWSNNSPSPVAHEDILVGKHAGKPTRIASSEDGSSRHMYPFSLLFRREDVHSVRSVTTTAEKGEQLASTPIGETLLDGKITVVFATNAHGFKIKHCRGFDIRRKHVDNEGILKNTEELNAIVGDHLDTSKVEIKFLICECQEGSF